MTKISNPFIIKGQIPDEYFCDRVQETQTLIQHVKNGRNVLLTSPRRVGKTGLIDHCFRQSELQDNYYSFFIDILETSDLRDFTYVMGREIFEKLKPRGRKVLDVFLTTVKSISGEFGYDAFSGMPKFSLALGAIQNPAFTLSEIFDYINMADMRCLIAIDEFQQISNYPEKNIEAILRTHIQHCSNADFIFAGSERHILTEMFNQSSRPFFASVTEMDLLELELDKYTEFVQLHLQEFGKNITADAVHKLYELFDGNTYCMQKTMNEVFAMSKEGSTITFDDICAAIGEIISENERNYRNMLSMISPKQKELLLAIATERKATALTSGAFVRRHQLSSASSVQSAIKQLLDSDWVTFENDAEGKRYYFVSDRFFALWLRQRFGGETIF